MSQAFKPRAYLLEGCPFSFKFLLFMAEAGLLEKMDIVRVKTDAPQLDDIKEMLSKGLGKRATFPTVEIERGKYLTDSDKLIEYFAKPAGVSANSPTMSFYAETILPQVVRLHKLEAER